MEEPTQKQASRIIDAKLPLSWLIGTASAVVFAMGGVYFKLETVSSSITKLESKTDNRDDRIATLTASLILQQGKNDTQDAQINRNHADIKDMRRDVDDIYKAQKWATKK